MTIKLDRDLALICRLDHLEKWNVVGNADDTDLDKATEILNNPFNDYVEWKNCGVVYRVIRKSDLGMYEGAER